MFRFVSVLGLAVLFAGGAYAEVPQQINHQGVVRVGGVPFSGTGLFKFAIVDPDTGNNLWTNDGVNQGTTGDPTAQVSIPVAGGVYSVVLGDTNLLPPGSMTVIPSTVFNDDNAELRIWFEDDQGTGMQLLTPNHKLTAAPYAHRTAVMPPIGSIVAWHKNFPGIPALPTGWLECDGVTVIPDGPLVGQTMPDLNGNVHGGGGRFVRGGAVSGALQDSTLIPQYQGQLPNSIMALQQVTNDDGLISPGGNGVFWPVSTNVGGNAFHAIRPANMSVVWIMRVK